MFITTASIIKGFLIAWAILSGSAIITVGIEAIRQKKSPRKVCEDMGEFFEDVSDRFGFDD